MLPPQDWVGPLQRRGVAASHQDLSERFHAIRSRTPGLHVDATVLESGFLRAPKGRRCAVWLVAVFGTLGTVRTLFVGVKAFFRQSACPLGASLTIFWLGAMLIALALVASVAFLKQNGAFAVYALAERACAFCMWLWCYFGCVTYIKILSYPDPDGTYAECLNGLTAAYSVLVYGSAFGLLVFPCAVIYFDLEHSESLRDPERSALLWREVTSGIRAHEDTHRAGEVYRNLPNNVALPAGFRCGVGAVADNNCFISSLVQLLRGAPESGPLHNAECAQIRQLGVQAGVWQASPAHIEAGQEAVTLVCQALQHDAVPNVVVFAGLRADLRQDVPGADGARTLHLFNPVGMHFDPLWPRSGVHQEYEMPLISG